MNDERGQLTDPYEMFGAILDEAMNSALVEPTAFCLATVDAQGRPAARMLLLKGFDNRGFTFYTNLDSGKARHLAQNPNAAMCFFWATLGKQIRIEGMVENVSDEEADEYFASRPRGSQIGAW